MKLLSGDTRSGAPGPRVPSPRPLGIPSAVSADLMRPMSRGADVLLLSSKHPLFDLMLSPPGLEKK